MSIKSNVLLSAIFFSLPLFAMPPSCRPLNSFEQGHELRQNQMMAAYNATARIDVRGSWDLYVTGGYIFWQPREENLELGIANVTSSVLPIDGRVVNMNFRYKSGFQAGFGLFTDRDNWDAYAQYTWFNGQQHSSIQQPANGAIIPFWGHPANTPTPSSILSAKSMWRLELNILDTELARSYYVGTKLAFRPFFGARAAWINQHYSALYILPFGRYPIHYASHSWGLGPETGINMTWLLGYGLRLIGNAQADVLFTRYNLHIQEAYSTPPSGNAVHLSQRHAFYLRPHSNLELGLGYGTYFFNHNYHWDLFATYGFQVFWNQNMFRNFVDNVSFGKSYAPAGDLYIHGVTGTMRFDF